MKVVYKYFYTHTHTSRRTYVECFVVAKQDVGASSSSSTVGIEEDRSREREQGGGDLHLL